MESKEEISLQNDSTNYKSGSRYNTGNSLFMLRLRLAGLFIAPFIRLNILLNILGFERTGKVSFCVCIKCVHVPFLDYDK